MTKTIICSESVVLTTEFSSVISDKMSEFNLIPFLTQITLNTIW